MSAPTRCEDVTFDMGDGSYERDLGWWEGGGVGSLIWNPKGGEGHVLVRVEKCTQGDWGALGGPIYNCCCDGFLGKCDSDVDLCECGEDNSWRDHHYRLLRKSDGK